MGTKTVKFNADDLMTRFELWAMTTQEPSPYDPTNQDELKVLDSTDKTFKQITKDTLFFESEVKKIHTPDIFLFSKLIKYPQALRVACVRVANYNTLGLWPEKLTESQVENIVSSAENYQKKAESSLKEIKIVPFSSEANTLIKTFQTTLISALRISNSESLKSRVVTQIKNILKEKEITISDETALNFATNIIDDAVAADNQEKALRKEKK